MKLTKFFILNIIICHKHVEHVGFYDSTSFITLENNIKKYNKAITEMCTPCPKDMSQTDKQHFQSCSRFQNKYDFCAQQHIYGQREKEQQNQPLSANDNSLVFTSNNDLDPCLQPITDPCDLFNILFLDALASLDFTLVSK